MKKSKIKNQTANKDTPSPAMSAAMPDPVLLGSALAKVYMRAAPIFQDAMDRYCSEASTQSLDMMGVGRTYTNFLEQFWKNPEQAWKIQAGYWSQFMDVWQQTALKLTGEHTESDAHTVKPQPGDRRFRDDEWDDNPVFDFLKQSYLLTSRWMEDTVRDTSGLSEEEKDKLAFYTRLFADALSPSNFVMTNPEVLRETINTGGENLIKGLENLVSDFERGEGALKISTTDYDAFDVGKNLAVTPGQVVYQNDLMQLIQYAPTTDNVFETPLLIVPPWINKYYILDLKPGNSFIEWAVSQGHTVFTISWVNGTRDMSNKRFEDYMEDGILSALSCIEDITGTATTNVTGYCLGGTLLAITLAYLEKKGGADRIGSATFLTTLLDFEKAGEMKLFLNEEQMERLDRSMAEAGVFEARKLQQTFSLLRANDLIWSFVVNNYLMGKEPFPFDLLYWNDDSTNMPAAMHSFYLRKMYCDNALVEPGGIKMHDTDIDISQIQTPAYFLSAKEDHIAPWDATYAGTTLFSGPVTFTLAASGHIAGVINSPTKNKYCYWSSEELPKDNASWMETSEEHSGSWWPHWQNWMVKHAGSLVAARPVKNGIEAAPGSYVQKKT